MYAITFWPIIVSSVIAFIIGALWYSPILFGKQWIELNKMDCPDGDASKTKSMWKLYVSQFVCTFITFYILSYIVNATGMIGGSSGALLGFIIWLGFIATNAVSSFLWENKPIKLILIGSASVLVNLVIGGAIIGAWR